MSEMSTAETRSGAVSTDPVLGAPFWAVIRIGHTILHIEKSIE